MMGITAEEFRKIVDKNHLTHRIDEDGDFLIGFASDEGDSRPMMIIYSIRDTQVHMRAYCQRLLDAGDEQTGMAICNQWNRERILPKAYLDGDRSFIAEWSLLVDDEVSLEYIDKFAIHIIPAVMGSFFEFADEKMHPNDDLQSAEFEDED